MALEGQDRNRSSRLGNAVRAAALAGMAMTTLAAADTAAAEPLKTEAVQPDKQSDTEKQERIAHLSQRIARLDRHVQEFENFLNSGLPRAIKDAFARVEKDIDDIFDMAMDMRSSKLFNPGREDNPDPRLEPIIDMVGGAGSPLSDAMEGMRTFRGSDTELVEKGRAVVATAREGIAGMRRQLGE